MKYEELKKKFVCSSWEKRSNGLGTKHDGKKITFYYFFTSYFMHQFFTLFFRLVTIE